MSQVINKQNIVIVIGTYNDKQTHQEKKQYKTIGELVTYQNDQGQTSQFGKMWGPGGATEFNIYEQEDRNQAVNQVRQAPQQKAPQQQRQAPPSQAPHQQVQQQAPQQSAGFDNFDDDLPL